jgi:queuine tRNA-ribosyltransferase
MEIQRTIGADIIMAFDECTLSLRLQLCEALYENDAPLVGSLHQPLDTLPFKYGYEQTFFPIVQGSTYKDLRAQSAEYIANSNQQGNAIGGLSVGNLQRNVCMTRWCVKFYQRTNQGI